ncbi:MAG: putative toxin-antitoxin system toxin component, PIN family, partial [Gammaproteobacteria bacterium]|nr:putative toxin-antitoxin system toxin component, PIN family [Gammaproteobacteria bacterium]
MRVVIDTNVWVSRLLLADSVAARAVDSALRNSEVIVSEPLIEELADVLAREKFDRYVSLAD